LLYPLCQYIAGSSTPSPVKIRIKNQIKKEMAMEIPAEVESPEATMVRRGEPGGARREFDDTTPIIVGGRRDEDGNVSDTDSSCNERVAFIKEWIARQGQLSFFSAIYCTLTGCKMNQPMPHLALNEREKRQKRQKRRTEGRIDQIVHWVLHTRWLDRTLNKGLHAQHFLLRRDPP
jgi:hypothetical protein